MSYFAAKLLQVAGLDATTTKKNFTDPNNADYLGVNNAGCVMCEERLFTEAGTVSGGTVAYTGTVTIRSGETVLDVQWRNETLWGAATSAVMSAGDGDDSDGYFTAVSVKTSPVSNVNGAGGISSFLSDTGGGAFKGLTKRYPSGGTITFTVIAVGTGATGVSRGIVYYSHPTSVDATSSS